MDVGGRWRVANFDVAGSDLFNLNATQNWPYSGRLSVGFVVSIACLLIVFDNSRARTLCLILFQARFYGVQALDTAARHVSGVAGRTHNRRGNCSPHRERPTAETSVRTGLALIVPRPRGSVRPCLFICTA